MNKNKEGTPRFLPKLYCENWKIKIVAIILLIGATFPIGITSVGPGLDPSGIYFLNAIPEVNLKFGSDLMFTYGPWGFLAFPLNIGYNALISLLFYGALIIIEVWLLWFTFRRLEGKCGVIQMVSFGLLILLGRSHIGIDYYISYLFFLSVSLGWVEETPHRYLIIGTILAVASMLIKLNLGMQCVITIVLFILGKLIVEKRKALRFLGYIPSIVGAYILAFLAHNPSLRDLVYYVSTSLEISSGYNEAMSSQAAPGVLMMAVTCGVCYCMLVLLVILADLKSGLYMLIFSGALFQIFKHGFVRGDHSGIFFAAFCIICAVEILFLDWTKLGSNLRQKRRQSYGILLVVIMAFLPLYSLNLSVQSIVNLYPAKLREVTSGVKERLAKPILDSTADILPDEILEIVGQDSVAIWPWELLIDAYNDINMVVMPSMTAYSAYTASLDAENAAFFAGESAPKYIIFGFETIDGRIPLLETPSSWQAIYENYQAVLWSGQYLLLKKMDTPYRMNLSEPEVLNCSRSEQVVLPAHSYVKVSTNLTLWGKLNKFFYQIPPVTVTLTYENGAQRTGRVLPDVLKNGIVFSDLPDSLVNMGLCLNGIERENKIVSFQFSGDGWKYYQDKMSVSFQTVSSQKEEYPYNPYEKIEARLEENPISQLHPTEISTPYVVDTANGVAPSNTVEVYRSQGLRLTGWALDDITKYSPSAIYFKVGDQYYQSIQTERADVYEYIGGYRGQPLCGFDGWISLRGYELGDYPVGLIIVSNDGRTYFEVPEIMTVRLIS